MYIAQSALSKSSSVSAASAENAAVPMLTVIPWSSPPRSRARDALPDALGDLHRGVAWGVEQDRRQFLTAVAGRQFDLADGMEHDAGDRAERLVAGDMAEAVVVTLEVIKVTEEERERPALLGRALRLFAQALFEGRGPAVERKPGSASHHAR